MQDLPIIQKSYDLVKWYVPILNRLPRSHRFMLGDRIITELYSLLKGLITARYKREKPAQLPLETIVCSQCFSAEAPATNYSEFVYSNLLTYLSATTKHHDRTIAHLGYR